jgi:hypothetical protein
LRQQHEERDEAGPKPPASYRGKLALSTICRMTVEVEEQAV